MRLAIIILLLSIAMAFMFSIKYKTRGKIAIKSEITREINKEKSLIKIMRAEVAYLESEGRIEEIYKEIAEGDQMMLPANSKIIKMQEEDVNIELYDEIAKID